MVEIKQFILDNLIALLGYLFGGGSFYAYFAEKKKRTLEEKQIGADALKTMQEGYDKFTANALEQYDTLKKEIDELKKKLTDVTSQLKEEEGKFNSLKNSYDKLKNSYDSLKREFDNYKKKHNT